MCSQGLILVSERLVLIETYRHLWGRGWLWLGQRGRRFNTREGGWPGDTGCRLYHGYPRENARSLSILLVSRQMCDWSGHSSRPGFFLLNLFQDKCVCCLLRLQSSPQHLVGFLELLASRFSNSPMSLYNDSSPVSGAVLNSSDFVESHLGDKASHVCL